MKKLLSVALSLVMLLSCLSVLAISTSARVTYPYGKHQDVLYQDDTQYVTHHITDTYYSSQNCFRISGRVIYHDNNQALINQTSMYCVWQITYASGEQTPPTGCTMPVIPNSNNYVDYRSIDQMWDASKIVSKIASDHKLQVGGRTATHLSSVYEP